MKLFTEIRKEDFQAFMREPQNARTMSLIDSFFQLKVNQRDIKSILCLLEGIAILAGMAGQDIAELNQIFKSNERGYDA